jgi:RNA polymerase sigma-54 factor
MQETLSQSFKQKQTLNPYQQLSIKILEIPQLELESYLECLIMQNPLLEYNEKKGEKDSKEFTVKELDFEKLTLSDVQKDEENLLSQQANEEATPSSFDQMAIQRESFYQHIDNQAHLYLNGPEYSIAQKIFPFLDDQGFLPHTLKELSSALGENEECLKNVIQKIQHFDPLGVASYSLSEYLQFHLHHEKIKKPLLERFIHNSFNDLLHKRFSILKRTYGPRLNFLIKELFLLIKKVPLNPKESRNINPVLYTKPDLILEKRGSYWHLSLKENNKRFHIKHYSYPCQNSSEEISQIKKFYKEAILLQKSLKQRNEMLLKIGKYLLKKQQRFFLKALPIHPITINELAVDLKIHLSTAYRAIKDKTIQTPDGIFLLSYFFTTQIQKIKVLEKAANQQILKELQLVATENHKSLHLPKRRFKKEKIFLIEPVLKKAPS